MPRMPLRLPAPILLATVALALSLALAACDDGTPAAVTDQLQVDTLASGAVQVTSPEGGLWALQEGDAEGEAAGLPVGTTDSGPFSLVEELRIGGEEEGPELLGSIWALGVDDEGRIHVLDSQASEVRVFGADGTWLRTLGGPGEGPGEFNNPAGIDLHPDDGSIWVMGPNRFTAFDPDGTFRSTHPRTFGYHAVPWPGGFGVDGALHDVASFDSFVRFSPDIQPADTFTVPRVETPTIRVVRTDGTGMMSMTPAFSPRLHWQFDPRGYIWSATSDEMRFVQQTLEGDTVRILRRPHTPVSVSAEEARQAVERMEEQIGRFGTDIEIEGDLVAGEFKPAFEAFFLDEVGRLWVKPTHPADADPVLELWSEEGHYLGRIETPEGFQALYPVPRVKGSHIWAVVTDEFDVPSVVRFRIEEGG